MAEIVHPRIMQMRTQNERSDSVLKATTRTWGPGLPVLGRRAPAPLLLRSQAGEWEVGAASEHTPQRGIISLRLSKTGHRCGDCHLHDEKSVEEAK